MRRLTIAAPLLAVAVAGTLSAAPVQAGTGRPVPGMDNCAANACHFDVPPGTYDVRVRLGGGAAASTSIGGETRRSLLPETATEAGRPVTRGFTVNVRTPEGEPTGPEGTPGLDLVIGGSAPALAGIRVTPAATREAGSGRPRTAASAPGRSSWSATRPSATSPATRTPAGASNCRSTSGRVCPSPTTRIPGRVRSPTSRTRRSSRPFSR